MAESKPLVVMAGPSEKRRRGRPVGSTKNATVLSQIESLLKRTQRVPEKRGRGRPRLIRIQVVDTPQAKVSERPRKSTAEHKEASGKTSVKISRREGLVRPRESADVMMSERRARPHLFLPERAVNIPVGSQVPIYKPNIKKKYMNEKGTSPRQNILVKKELQASLVEFIGTKRGRGRPRKDTTSTGIASGKTQNKMKPAGLASVAIVMEKKRGRGRPRKVPPGKCKQDQVTIFSRDFWNSPVQYEQCEEMDLFQSSTDFINSYRPKNPAEMPVGAPEPSQVRQEARSPGVDLHSDWVSGAVMNKEEDPEQRTEYQHPYWVTKPLAPQWTPETEEDADNTLDNNSMSQWETTVSPVPQSQYPDEATSQQINYQEDLLQGLADFKSQLVNELAATRAEIREGAQLLRSAISAVSAEIHQLGQILQPLVSVITSSIVSPQGHPAAFVSRPPQDTPPDDAVNITQPSAHSKTSSSVQDKVFDHSPKSPTDSEIDEICVVKMEDVMDSAQPCTPQAQSDVSTEVD